jgi:hypothetical protein
VRARLTLASRALSGQDSGVTLIGPSNSLILLVGREEFTPPATLAESIAAATEDCVAVGVRTVDDGPTTVALVPKADASGQMRLGDFAIETDGRASVRDAYNREYVAIAPEPGRCFVTVWGNDTSEPDQVIFEVSARSRA